MDTILQTQENEGLAIKNIYKTFGDTTVLNDVTLTVRPGEFFTLLGPSGCGKTTLLRIIAGLELADSGKIFSGGKDITDLPAIKRQVNTVFQSYALFPHLNIYENVAFGLRSRKFPEAEITKRVNRRLEMLDLAHMAQRYPHQLGTVLAIGMDRFPWGRRTNNLLDIIVHIPVVIPDIILPAALVVVFGLLRMVSSRFEPGLMNMIIGHITFQIAFVALVVRSRLVAIGREVEEAARDLFATNWMKKKCRPISKKHSASRFAWTFTKTTKRWSPSFRPAASTNTMSLFPRIISCRC